MAFPRVSSSLPFLGFVILCFTVADSTEVLVGGKVNSWKVPSSPSKSLNRWAFKLRFAVNDSLVFKFDEKVDSVLEVSKDDYKDCKTSDPIKARRGGLIKIKLPKSGHYYFIIGDERRCKKGLKLMVIARKRPRRPVVATPPSPAPATPPSPDNDDLVPNPAPSPNGNNFNPAPPPYLDGSGAPQAGPSPGDGNHIPRAPPSPRDDNFGPVPSPSDNDYVPGAAPSPDDDDDDYVQWVEQEVASSNSNNDYSEGVTISE